jgi:hypothetical protein
LDVLQHGYQSTRGISTTVRATVEER